MMRFRLREATLDDAAKIEVCMAFQGNNSGAVSRRDAESYVSLQENDLSRNSRKDTDKYIMEKSFNDE